MTAMQMRDIVAGVKLEKSSASMERQLDRLEACKEKAGGVVNCVTHLEGSEDAVAEVMVAEENVNRLVPQVRLRCCGACASVCD
jgi:hypothetical protein